MEQSQGLVVPGVESQLVQRLMVQSILACEAGVSVKPGALAPGSIGFRKERARVERAKGPRVSVARYHGLSNFVRAAWG